MTELILGPILRHVDTNSATVWVETDSPATVEVLGRTARTFCVRDHHYALVIIEGLEPGQTIPYEVALDGERCWPPPDDRFPPCVIRTLGEGVTRVLFGSCRTAAPHEPPYTLDLALDPVGRGVDALREHALTMMKLPPREWPDLALFLGDQVYADDSSPETRKRVAERRKDTPVAGLPSELVNDFDEYCWLYHESWRPEVERWFLSVVPTAMIFDDHEMIDDWNISAEWVHDMQGEPWWTEHRIGCLMSYWIYQHLGNLAPSEIRADGMLERLLELGDGEQFLREWALEAEEFSPEPGGYRFSYSRRLGDVVVVIVDCRNGRVLQPGHRSMVDDDEWKFVVERCTTDARHLLIGTSLPVFMAGGIPDMQRWSERVCDGKWGPPGRWVAERLRRRMDADHWPSFMRSFDAMVELLAELGRASRADRPASISVLSGDIHFSFHGQIHFPAEMDVATPVHQLVNSPLRNQLRPEERLVIRFMLSRAGRTIGRMLRRSVGDPPSPVTWQIDHGPVFANSVAEITFDGDDATLCIERALAGEDGHNEIEVAFDVELSANPAGSTSVRPPSAVV
jgi:hypothetical protein